MKRILIGSAAVAAIMGFVVAAEDPFLAVGSPAPGISGKASDGKDYSTEAMAKKGSVFVVFWKERCPHNGVASALYNALAKAYGEKAPMLGVVPATEERAKAWAERFTLTYPMLADTDRKFIQAYKLRFSIGAFEIKDGKVAAVFPGYGIESMTALKNAMAKASGVENAEVDLSKAPTRLTWG